MKALVCCEESQAVTIALRNKGVEAFSNDLLACSGGHPEWHIQGDARTLLSKSNLQTIHIQGISDDRYDLVISFPPCTDLAVSGARWFNKKRLSGEQEKSIEFFLFTWFYSHCTENPIGIMNDGRYIKKWFPKLHAYAIENGFPFRPTQIIQPWQFGHKETKATCLWLKGLPALQPTGIVGPPPKGTTKEQKLAIAREWNKVHRCPPGADRAVIRSKTYTGIAAAMASQWSIIHP